MAGARQRLLIVEDESASLGADGRARAGASATRTSGSVPTASCCSRTSRTRTTSPSCGSSTPTAPRPSSPATAPARRSSTCGATAGPTRTSSRSSPRRGRSRRRSRSERTCTLEMGRASHDFARLPDGGEDGRGEVEAGGSDVGLPARLDRQPAVRDRSRGRARDPRPAEDRARRSRTAALFPNRTNVSFFRVDGAPGPGADLRARRGGDALLGHRRLRCRGRRASWRAPRARSPSSSTAASCRSRSARTSTCG